ncbi:carbamoyl phosphate synthase small subunit [candidate division MSBL1 archaeon SCGC-AAA259I09]|uniref:Carbamoyl phosphate synthase small chain n=2 Tax=candidate division MSBL1 TaxID=215777 RepID=A0A133USU3_9EURY|nr:carbamoyl phosphate synthase small subunit [candidate division MSBL1 archaeon SCGC-AAA259I09]KXA99833.1 carbamoyl phosphate synthase small subunit [candidate division MSBL1 archaeon SCGC-AAA259M10]
MKAYLALEDGTVVEGKGFGSPGKAKGELVFQTGMTGYVEALTDPSYNGQILMLTYPLIGNYGVVPQDYESEGIKAEALVIRDLCQYPSNWRSEMTLDQFLKKHDIPGIEKIDTRKLTRKARIHGTMKAILEVGEENVDEKGLVRKAREQKSIEERENLVPQVSIKGKERFEGEGNSELVMIDCGYKNSILTTLHRENINVTIVPYDTSAENILDLEPDGALVSNGPGNPALLEETIDTIEKLLEETVLYGICLGNQLISLATGAETYKLKFGHRGINHPVKHLETGRVSITTQNHGFAVTEKSLQNTGLEATQINLNDKTIEAIEHENLPVKAVQYHPEAGPGPHDALPFFKQLKNRLQTK